MRRYFKIITAVFCCAIFITKTSCIKKYDAGVNVPAKGYLVVEGFINSDGGSSTIYLSRAQSNHDTAKIVFERKATVTIQSDNNAAFPLTETSAGTYTSAPITLDKNAHYRVHIKTSNGQEYNSDYSNVRSTPAYDSVFWTRDNDKGVQFFVNTHDATNNTRYYMWKWGETWVYHSNFQSNLKFTFDKTDKIDKAVFIFPDRATDNSLFTCYHADSSTNIAIGSSEKLAQDIIQNAPIGLTIPPGDEKLGVLFSLHVKQYAISKNAYLFYQLLQKNTEQLGSIFDVQPSQVTGNIHSVSDITEKVIGFVEVTQEIRKRIFIANSELPNWGYSRRCDVTDTTLGNDSASLNKFVLAFHLSATTLSTNWLPTLPVDNAGYDMNGLPLVIGLAVPDCVDCKLRGGTPTKPPFWP